VNEADRLLRLYILRHAKSSWALPGITDFNRGLNDRGSKDLAKIANLMITKPYIPEQIYCSSAVRTSKTIEGIRSEIQNSEHHKNAPPKMPVEYIENLYSGTIDNYLNVIKTHNDNNQSVMLVGHNPTCHSLTSRLIADGRKKALAALSFNFPTGALAVIDIESDNWADIEERSGYLQDFVLPRKLPVK
jgi:phosphohistidine phosphatase